MFHLAHVDWATRETHIDTVAFRQLSVRISSTSSCTNKFIISLIINPPVRLYPHTVLFDFTASDVYENPCSPSPCGPNSQCRESNGQGVCSCLPNYVGSPPGCRPECVVSSECSFDKACVNQKCVNPCTAGTCAANAICRVNNHSPICACNDGFTGNPFTICNRIPRKIAIQLNNKFNE